MSHIIGRLDQCMSTSAHLPKFTLKGPECQLFFLSFRIMATFVSFRLEKNKNSGLNCLKCKALGYLLANLSFSLSLFRFIVHAHGQPIRTGNVHVYVSAVFVTLCNFLQYPFFNSRVIHPTIMEQVSLSESWGL